MIVTTDWHLTDRVEDLYRWDIFNTLQDIMKRTRDNRLLMLGDITDRKDRHSAALVNKMTEHLVELDADITILMGNHDMPLRGAPYWEFLNRLMGVHGKEIAFVTTPQKYEGAWLLPFSPDPVADWAKLDFRGCKAAFMHQTVDGSIGNNGHVLKSSNMFVFPRSIKIYSGDVHVPQVVGRVTYVGAPHPIDFGDNYECRVLRLSPIDYTIIESIPVRSMLKPVLTVTSVGDLMRNQDLQSGDQVKLRFMLSVNDIELWPTMQAHIKKWAEERGVQVSSVETLIHSKQATSLPDAALSDPAMIIRNFAAAESLDDNMLNAGLAILEKEVGT